MIKAVIFDLDSTLVLDEELSERAFHTAAALAEKLEVNIAELAQSARRICGQLWKDAPHHQLKTSLDHDEVEGLWANYSVDKHMISSALLDWSRQFRISVWLKALAEHHVHDGALAEQMANTFIETRSEICCYPDSQDVLKSLSSVYKLGMITNGLPSLQRFKLDRSGLAAYFDVITVSGEIHINKPEPEIFRQTCTQLKVNPEECVMVGDNFTKDIDGAARIGMSTIWINRRISKPANDLKPNYECGELIEILEYLQMPQR